MGKPTGFLEYLRELPLDRPALERIHDWNEFHLHMAEAELRKQGARCMDCGIPVLPHRHAPQRHGQRLPHPQPHPGMERPRLSRPVEGSARTAPQDQQFPRFHRPRLPRAVRRLVRARHQRPARHHQEHRVRHHRPRLGRRLDDARARRSSAPAKKWPSSVPARPACAPPRN